MKLTHRRLLALLAPLFIIIAVLLDLDPGLRHEDKQVVLAGIENQATTTEDGGVVTVRRIVDGDTIIVAQDGVDIRVRLIGINAPESVDPRRPVQCFGKEASEHMKQLALGQQVRLVLDPSQDRYDAYGRLLAYVYRFDGVFVNEAMIHDGFAYEYTFKTPYAFQQEFKRTESEARGEANGLWSPDTCNGRY